MSARVRHTLLSERGLPEGSKLRNLYDAYQQRVAESKLPQGKLAGAQNELSEVNYYLETATLETTTAEAYAVALARKILLERAEGAAEKTYERAQHGYDTAKNYFYDHYRRYEHDMHMLQTGLTETGRPLLATERDEIEARVAEVIGTPKSSRWRS